MTSKGAGYVISPGDAKRLFRLALEDFAPDWEITADLTEITIRDPDH